MANKIQSALQRLRKLADYAADLLEQIRKTNALQTHFENQNATMFGVAEIMKRLNEFDRLRVELQKANQLVNVTAAELAAFNDFSERLQRKMAEMERSLGETRTEIAQLKEELSREKRSEAA